jgi:hypothetical protein
MATDSPNNRSFKSPDFLNIRDRVLGLNFNNLTERAATNGRYLAGAFVPV